MRSCTSWGLKAINAPVVHMMKTEVMTSPHFHMMRKLILDKVFGASVLIFESACPRLTTGRDETLQHIPADSWEDEIGRMNARQRYRIR